MKNWLALLLLMLLLTACTPRHLYSAYHERNRAEGQVRGADAMALVTVGDNLPSYEMAGRIYTDTQVTVIRGSKLTVGAKITLHRGGGSITDSGGNIRSEFVSYTYGLFPPKGEEVFLILKQIGEQYEILDLMALKNGRPVSDRPANQVYMSYLDRLK